MKALETVNKKEAAPTYNRTKSAKDSVGYKHKTEPDFVGSGYHPPERFVPLLAKLSHPANATQRIQLFAQLQTHYGNRYVQRIVSAYKSQNVEEDERKLVSEIISNKGSGRALEPEVREFMEPRFRYDFSHVRVHTDSYAARKSNELNAEAFTIGRDIFFNAGRYNPSSTEGKRLLGHELTHVVQQGEETLTTQPEQQITSIYNGAYRIAVAPVVGDDSDDLERQADAVADHVIGSISSKPFTIDQKLQTSKRSQPIIQRVIRVPLPIQTPLCGRTLTHIDVEPPRWRPLVPCLPPTILVNRVNIVGREVSSRSTGRGRMVFNLHVGYFRDPATGRLCAIIDDSLTCIAPRCMMLGCFPTLREVIDAILDFLKEALKVIGIIILVIILVIIGRGLIRTGPMPGPTPVPVIAAGGNEEGGAEETEAEV